MLFSFLPFGKLYHHVSNKVIDTDFNYCKFGLGEGEMGSQVGFFLGYWLLVLIWVSSAAVAVDAVYDRREPRWWEK